VLPLSFGYGLYQVFTSVKTGGTVILEKSFTFPSVVMKRLKEERATGFPIVPTIAAVLLQMKDFQPGGFPHLRYMTNAAAALPTAHIERLRELFPTTRLYSMYGQTECTRCTYLPPEQLDIRPGSVGKAIPNTESYIVNDAGERVGPGEVGELVIRGGHVMQGYWEKPEETAEKLRPGLYPWERVLYTGDLFKRDEEGFLYFVERKDDIIKTRGEKVAPKEVENAIYAMAGVQDAAVVGQKDDVLGQAIRAFVVLTEGTTYTARDVVQHCAARLEAFMVPKYVTFVSSIPKTPSGKITKKNIWDHSVGARVGGDEL
jgi:acyl-CoA synthetase (AMP-forming)/AMP-acid ligase II